MAVPESYTIEPAVDADRGAILALFAQDDETKRLWPSAQGRTVWHWYSRSSARGVREFFDKCMQTEGVFCPVMVGFIHWRIGLRGADKGRRKLLNMVVSHAVQGQGIGRLLVEHMGLGQHPIDLVTDEGSRAATFYERLGFIRGETTTTRNGKKRVVHYSHEGKQ